MVEYINCDEEYFINLAKEGATEDISASQDCCGHEEAEETDYNEEFDHLIEDFGNFYQYCAFKD